LAWTDEELETGKIIHLKKFPKGHQVKLFRIAMSAHRTEHTATNNYPQNSSDVARRKSAIGWKIQQFHQKVKQVTWLKSCQCRSQRAQRNHIASAMLFADEYLQT